MKERLGIQIICRDCGGNYAEGARQGAPSATQVADRFHLMQNLATALERLVVRLHPALQEVTGKGPPPEMAAAPSDAASSGVPSTEPVSTTTISSTHGRILVRHSFRIARLSRTIMQSDKRIRLTFSACPFARTTFP